MYEWRYHVYCFLGALYILFPSFNITIPILTVLLLLLRRSYSRDSGILPDLPVVCCTILFLELPLMPPMLQRKIIVIFTPCDLPIVHSVLQCLVFCWCISNVGGAVICCLNFLLFVSWYHAWFSVFRYYASAFASDGTMKAEFVLLVLYHHSVFVCW
jgi:hypothetical protein